VKARTVDVRVEEAPLARPASARREARLTQIVDFPTPPLPLATAMMFFTPGIGAWESNGFAAGFSLRAPLLRAPVVRFASRRASVVRRARGTTWGPVMTDLRRPFTPFVLDENVEAGVFDAVHVIPVSRGEKKGELHLASLISMAWTRSFETISFVRRHL